MTDTRKVLEIPRAEAPAASCAVYETQDGEMYLHSRCHIGAPQWVVLEADRKHLRVECSTCHRVIARFEVKL